MRALPFIACLCLLPIPGFAAEKLPIELPNVVVTGKGTTAQTVGEGGTKVPLRPEVQGKTSLPPPAEQRASAKMVPMTAVEATPSVSLSPLPSYSPVSRHAEAWIGAGNGLELGGYFGTLEPGLATIEGLAWLTPGWSAVSLEGNLDRGIPLHAAYDFRGWSAGSTNWGGLEASGQIDRLRYGLATGLGWLPGDRIGDLGGTVSWQPDLSEEHQPLLSLALGRQTTLNRSDLRAQIGAQDRWQWDQNWALAGGAETGTLKGVGFFDPRFAVDWRPDPGASLVLSLRQETGFPLFKELYDRLWIQGNPNLLAEHRSLIELSGGRLLDKEVYFDGKLRYGKGEHLLALQYTGSTWCYQNLPVIQDTWEGLASLQFTQPDFTHKLLYRLDSLHPLGATSQRVGLSREGKWDRFSYEVGTDLDWQQLGTFQTGGNPEAGWLWLLHGQLGYRLDPSWQVNLTANDLSMLEKQPLNHFFTPLSFFTVGLKGVF